MKTIMSRNSKGIVTINGKIKCKIPLGKSMLSVLSDNPSINNATYSDKGWVLDKKGNKIRKWLIRIEGTKVWEPILDNIPALELRYQKLLKHREKVHSAVFLPAFEALDKVGKAHAKPTHKYDGSQQWWIWHICNDTHYGKSFGYDWVDAPKKPIRHEIGQRFYEADCRMAEVYGRVSKFRKTLEQAIENYLWKHVEPTIKDVGKTLKLVINDRIYWYVGKFHGSVPVWEKVNWPDEEMKIVELK